MNLIMLTITKRLDVCITGCLSMCVCVCVSCYILEYLSIQSGSAHRNLLAAVGGECLIVLLQHAV